MVLPASRRLLPLPLVPWHRLIETTPPALPAAPHGEAPTFTAPRIPPEAEALIDVYMASRPPAPSANAPVEP